MELGSGVATGALGGARAPPTQMLAPVGIAQNRGDTNIYMGGVPRFGHMGSSIKYVTHLGGGGVCSRWYAAVTRRGGGPGLP